MAGQRKTLGSLVAAADSAPPVPAARADRPARPDRAAKDAEPAAPEKAAAAADMTMRSWYMPRASAGQIAAFVDDVHFATRLPKHVIMVALANVIVRYRAEVEAEAWEVAGQ